MDRNSLIISLQNNLIFQRRRVKPHSKIFGKKRKFQHVYPFSTTVLTVSKTVISRDVL